MVAVPSMTMGVLRGLVLSGWLTLQECAYHGLADVHDSKTRVGVDVGHVFHSHTRDVLYGSYVVCCALMHLCDLLCVTYPTWRHLMGLARVQFHREVWHTLSVTLYEC